MKKVADILGLKGRKVIVLPNTVRLVFIGEDITKKSNKNLKEVA